MKTNIEAICKIQHFLLLYPQNYIPQNFCKHFLPFTKVFSLGQCLMFFIHFSDIIRTHLLKFAKIISLIESLMRTFVIFMHRFVISALICNFLFIFDMHSFVIILLLRSFVISGYFSVNFNVPFIYTVGTNKKVLIINLSMFIFPRDDTILDLIFYKSVQNNCKSAQKSE